MEILCLKKRMVDILHEKQINRELVIVPVDILKELGCINDEVYEQWTKGEITTLDAAFELPVSSIRDLAFYLRGWCRQHDHALLRNFLKNRSNGKDLKVSERKGLHLLLSDAFYVERAFLGLRRSREKSRALQRQKSNREGYENKSKRRPRRSREKTKHMGMFSIPGAV